MKFAYRWIGLVLFFGSAVAQAAPSGAFECVPADGSSFPRIHGTTQVPENFSSLGDSRIEVTSAEGQAPTVLTDLMTSRVDRWANTNLIIGTQKERDLLVLYEYYGPRFKTGKKFHASYKDTYLNCEDVAVGCADSNSPWLGNYDMKILKKNRDATEHSVSAKLSIEVKDCILQGSIKGDELGLIGYPLVGALYNIKFDESQISFSYAGESFENHDVKGNLVAFEKGKIAGSTVDAMGGGGSSFFTWPFVATKISK